MPVLTDDEIRALLEAATPGPWTIERCPCRHDRCDYHGTSNGSFSQGSGYRISDARLIAAAPDAFAEVLRLREALRGAAASLVAAVSLLERGGKKAAPSDKMFAVMLDDYRASIERARAALKGAAQ